MKLANNQLYETMSTSQHDLTLRHPSLTDGTAVFDLVDDCKPLDLNSHYLYLLQCSHFSQNCVVAFSNNKLLGWLSSYLHPDHSETLFLWQLAVSKQARGFGLAKKMIDWIVAQQKGIAKIHTSITADNEASWAVFRSVAKHWGVELTQHNWFDGQAHFSGRHDSEFLVEIPLPTSSASTTSP